MFSIDELVNTLHKKIENLTEDQRDDCSVLFYAAYVDHKKQFGSFKSLSGEAYQEAMKGRQDYMFEIVDQHIEGYKNDK